MNAGMHWDWVALEDIPDLKVNPGNYIAVGPMLSMDDLRRLRVGLEMFVPMTPYFREQLMGDG